MPSINNIRLRKVVTKLWNSGKKSSEIANNKVVKRLCDGKLNAATIGFYVEDLRRRGGVDLTYRGHEWQRKRYKDRRSIKRKDRRSIKRKKLKHERSILLNNSKREKLSKLLEIGSTLKGEKPTQYLIKVLTEAVNNDFIRCLAAS